MRKLTLAALLLLALGGAGYAATCCEGGPCCEDQMPCCD